MELSNAAKQLMSVPVAPRANPPVRRPFTPVQNTLRNGVLMSCAYHYNLIPALKAHPQFLGQRGPPLSN